MKAIVTGAANGIGRAIALRLAKDAFARDKRAAGFVLLDLDGDRLQSLKQTLEAQGCTVATVVGNVGDPGVCCQVVVTADETLGGLDVLISNIGINRRVPLLDVGLDVYEEVFAVNTRSALLLAQAAHPLLQASKGNIVVIASLASEHPAPPQAVYSASKAAVVMLVRQMANEWAKDGIRCNVVSPGPTLTDMSAHYGSEVGRREARARVIPLGRLAEPEEVANAAAFLAGPDASFITGVNLLVDGGFSTVLLTQSGKSGS